MKKAIVTILTAAMLATLVSGCGGSTTAAPQSAQSESGEPAGTDKPAEAEAAEGTAAEESSEAEKAELKPYYVRTRETMRNADGAILNDRCTDDHFNTLWYISSYYSDPSEPTYSVTVYDYEFNDKGRVAVQKMYSATQLDSVEGFNPDDYKTDDYLQDTTTYTYDENGNALSIESASYQMAYEYDANGSCIKTIETRTYGDTTYTRTSTMTYDENGKLISQTDESDDSSYVSEYTYDDKGNQIKYVRTNSNDPEDVRTYENIFDENGTIIKSVSTGSEYYDNSVSEYTFDSEGRQITKRIETDAEGNELISESIYYGGGFINLSGYEYKSNNTPVTYTSEVKYDDKGNPTNIIKTYDDGTSAEEVYEFDENGNLVRMTVTNVEGDYRYQDGTTYEYEYALVTPEQK